MMPDKTDYTSGVVLRRFTLSLRPGEKDLSRAGVSMPPGADPCDVIAVADGFHVLAMCRPTSLPDAWHPIQLAMIEEVIMPQKGRQFGRPIAVLKMPHGAPVAFLPDLPWPVTEHGGGQ